MRIHLPNGAAAMTMLLRIAYDGSGYSGFARQAEGARRVDGSPVRTIQGVLEAALEHVFRVPVTTQGASRTDAGVHALGQLVALEAPIEIAPDALLRALATKLPADIVATAAWNQSAADEPSSPRHDNAGKHYRYRMRCTAVRDAIGGRFEWHVARALDIEPMRRAAQFLCGTHDFSSFQAADCQAKSAERTIRRIAVEGFAAPVGPITDEGRPPSHAPDDVVTIDVWGTAFLKNMVRIIAGTLFEVGAGKRSVDSVAQVLDARDRTTAGVTAPAQGLTLVEVLWPSRRPSS